MPKAAAVAMVMAIATTDRRAPTIIIEADKAAMAKEAITIEVTAKEAMAKEVIAIEISLMESARTDRIKAVADPKKY